MKRSRLAKLFVPAIIVLTMSVTAVALMPVLHDAEDIAGVLSGDYSAIIFTTLFFVGICTLVQILLRRGSKRVGAWRQSFIADERAANTARRQNIGESLFVKASFPAAACIPQKGEPLDAIYNDVLQKQGRAQGLASKPMLKLHMTNNELKQNFGPQNIEIISVYEENFDKYIRTLLDWAEALSRVEMDEKAIMVLEEASVVGADTSQVYIILADLYHKAGRTAELAALLEHASGLRLGSFGEIARTKIEKHIRKYL